MKTNVMQIVRLVMMIVAVAGIIYALEYMERGMEGRHLWKPMNLQPVFASAPFVKVNEEVVCDDLFARGVCLPSDTKMSMDDVDRVCAAIREMF